MRRGEVVLVDWPFSDRTGTKLRPAVVVQADFLNHLIADTVLIAVTRTSRSAKTQVLIDPTTETNSGLRQRSVASCNNLLTIDQVRIHQFLGELSAATMQMIDERLKVALDLL